MDRISAMQAFARVVEAGSFTRAAHIMDVPKPTISRLVQGLETRLGVRLLQRNTRTITPTSDGQAYYARVVSLLAELDDLEASARHTKAAPSGHIRVELGTSMAAMVVIPALPQFYQRYPDMQVELCIGNGDRDMIADGIDCALRIGPIMNDSLVGRVVGQLHFTTCASPQYLQRFGVPRHPEELEEGHQTVGLVFSHLGPKALPFVFHQGDQQLSLVRQHVLEVNDTHASLAAALSGLGMVQAPAIAMEQALQSGQLTAVLQDWIAPPHPVRILYPCSRFLSTKVRVFMDWLITLIHEHSALGDNVRPTMAAHAPPGITRRGNPSQDAAALP